MVQARGVLPHQHDKVMASPNAQGAIVTVRLRPGVDADAARAWLAAVEQGIAALRAETAPDGSRVATVATGFGPSFFTTNGAPRFPAVAVPACFERLPVAPGTLISADAVFYVVSLSEGVTARFLHLLWDTRPDVEAVHVERGYARLDGTEPFGYKDGVRNVVPKTDRRRTVYVDADRHADEPAVAVGGTYLAYMRIGQDTDAFRRLDPAAQDRAVGRTRDGNRLDLPPGTDPAAEGEFTGDGCPAGSHVRKAGPRGRGNDTVDVFRRGMPFCEVRPDGTLAAGLQFVSFQASLDQFDVVLNRWMLNPDFPAPGTGPDALVGHGVISIEKHGFFFVPAETDGSIAATLFKERGKPARTKTGRIAVRKSLVDAATKQPSLLGLDDFRFQVTRPDGTPVGPELVTDAAGHALSYELDAGDYSSQSSPRPRP